MAHEAALNATEQPHVERYWQPAGPGWDAVRST